VQHPTTLLGGRERMQRGEAPARPEPPYFAPTEKQKKQGAPGISRRQDDAETLKKRVKRLKNAAGRCFWPAKVENFLNGHRSGEQGDGAGGAPAAVALRAIAP